MIPAFPALVSALALLLYIAVFVAVGRVRLRYKIMAPAVTGAPEFERAFRIQQNTLEQLVWFIPALWLFSLYVSPAWGGIIGLVWIAGRAYYAISYYRDPETRGPGFMIGFASAALLIAPKSIGARARRPSRGFVAGQGRASPAFLSLADVLLRSRCALKSARLPALARGAGLLFVVITRLRAGGRRST